MAQPFIVILRNHSTARALDEPAPTVTTSGAHLALCEPFLLGQQSGATARVVDDPAPTVTTGGAISLIEPFLFANRTNNRPRNLDEPVPTLCTADHIALIEPFLIKFYGTGRSAPLTRPLDTITTRDRFGLVMVNGREYKLDIRFRMLAPHELAQAQGFARNDHFCGTRSESAAPDRERRSRQHRAGALRGGAAVAQTPRTVEAEHPMAKKQKRSNTRFFKQFDKLPPQEREDQLALIGHEIIKEAARRGRATERTMIWLIDARIEGFAGEDSYEVETLGPRSHARDR